jgi:hypothetical protein
MSGLACGDGASGRFLLEVRKSIRSNSTSYSVPSAFEMSLPFAMLRRLPDETASDRFYYLLELLVRPIGNFADVEFRVCLCKYCRSVVNPESQPIWCAAGIELHGASRAGFLYRPSDALRLQSVIVFLSHFDYLPTPYFTPTEQARSAANHAKISDGATYDNWHWSSFLIEAQTASNTP